MRHHSISKLLFAVYGILLSGVNLCHSQADLRFEHFTSENGLSENFIYTVYQDKKGFLWIGTHDGLNRYDGYTFKKFKHDPADSNSIPDNTIYSICEDKEGNFWMGTNAGLCKYDPITGKFRRIPLPKKINSVEQVVVVNERELMIWYQRNLSLINVHTQTEIPITYKDSGGLHNLRSLPHMVALDRKGNIYIIIPTWGDVVLFKYNQGNNYFTKFATLAVPAEMNYLIKGQGYFHIDSRNRVWLPLANTEVYIFNLPSFIKSDEPVQPVRIMGTGTVRHILEDWDNNIWLASNEGLLFNEGAGNESAWYKQDHKNPASISSDDVHHIFLDRTGILWIATSNGLNKVNPFQKKFAHITRTEEIGQGLYHNFVLGVYPEGNEQVRIHYNFFGELVFTRYNIRSKNLKHIPHKTYDPAAWIRGVAVQNPGRLTNEILTKIIGTYEKLLGPRWLDKTSGQIWIDQRQQPWYEQNGLNSIDDWLADTAIVDIRLKDNDLWIASAKGLIQFNTVTKTSVVYSPADKDTSAINSTDITCFVFEEDSNMWIGTKGGGLNYFDRSKNVFTHYTEKDGLCNNSIYCMVKDNNGHLWIGTSLGLSNFDPVSKKFKNYFRADGLINNEYNRKSACKMPDGTIFMGGMNGIDFFHPDSLVSNKSKPQVQITDFKIFNQSIYPETITSLKHDQNSITIEFAAMDFHNPAANKFAYKLEGADKEWVILEGRNFTTYSYLQPGRYRFLVKAANSDGVWNEEPAIFDFTILPAWYQTWWFIAIIAAACAAAIYNLFRYRLRQKLKLFAVRNRLHRDLHDDVGATLSSVKAYSEILKDNPNNPVIAELIKDNSTEMIERLEVISWATNPQHDHFKSLKSRMIKFASPLCHSKNIQCNIQSDGINEEMLMPGEVRQNIFLIFKESINNTIKYAEATECNVMMSIQSSQFILKITDDGKGTDGTIMGNGEGWRNMKKRSEQLKGKLAIDTAPGKGTVTVMTLPYPFKIPSSWDGNKT